MSDIGHMNWPVWSQGRIQDLAMGGGGGQDLKRSA